MYPPTHPAIQSRADPHRVAAGHGDHDGPFSFTVMPDALLVEGADCRDPESRPTELAVLLHDTASAS